MDAWVQEIQFRRIRPSDPICARDYPHPRWALVGFDRVCACIPPSAKAGLNASPCQCQPVVFLTTILPE